MKQIKRRVLARLSISASPLDNAAKICADLLSENTPKFTANPGLVTWLSRASALASKKPTERSLNTLAKALSSKPVVVTQTQSKNAQAVAAAKTLLVTSIPKLYSMAVKESGSISDFDMVGLYLGDCADHLSLACFLYSGDLTAARKAHYMMDTSSRDLIPSSVSKFVDKLS